MKKIEITYTRKITFIKIVEVEDDVAENALSLDGQDLSMPRGVIDYDKGWYLITETLTDGSDVYDSADEIEDLSVKLVTPKN